MIPEALQAADLADMFDLAPVSLWLEDYSAVHELFAQWRADGISDVRSHLRADKQHRLMCSQRIRVIQVNRRTLELFGAESLEHLVASLHCVFRDDMLDQFVEELAQLWDGANRFSNQTVNYSLAGRRLDIVLNGTGLPGHEGQWDRVLLSLEDVTERATAQREQREAQQYALGLFEHSPVSLWLKDFSSVKQLLDGVRDAGVSDFRTFTDVHPEFVQRCMQEIRVVDVNRQTLAMFAASDRQALLNRLGDVFRDRHATALHRAVDRPVEGQDIPAARGLKAANDSQGHAAGDGLLRRAGEVLAKAVDKGVCAARIGGDEFALMLPATDEHGGVQMMHRVQELAALNNQFCGGLSLSFAMGAATCQQGERLEAVAHLADQRMYTSKHTYYEQADTNRRAH